MCFTFSRFFSDFAPYQGRPPEPLRIFRLLTCGSLSQYTYKQFAKRRTAISSKLYLLEISNCRRHIFARLGTNGLKSHSLKKIFVENITN
jgi:hypothetical protein